MLEFAQIPDLLQKNGEVIAETTAQYEFLEGMLKNVLANAAPVEGSETHKEREARKSQDYVTALEGLRQARKEMLIAKTKQEALQARFSWYMSTQATKRAEINLL